MHFSKISSVLSVMLAASASGAPAPQAPSRPSRNSGDVADMLARIESQEKPDTVEKRQSPDQPSRNSGEVADMLARIESQEKPDTVEKRQMKEAFGLAGDLMDRVDKHLTKAFWEKPEQYNGRHIQGKATHFGSPDGEKKVGPNWLGAQTDLYCDWLVDGGHDDVLVSERYPMALRGADWPARQDETDNQHAGDWVEISLAWSQSPNFQGVHVDMTASLCKDIIKWGVAKTTKDGRTQGFSAVHNEEWVLELDVTNQDDDDYAGKFGHIQGPQKPFTVSQDRWDEFLEAIEEDEE